MLALVPRTSSAGHEVARYWSVYVLLASICVGALPAVLPGRWAALPPLAVVAAAVLAAGTAPGVLPPPGRSSAAVFTTLGSHRTPERLGGREGVSDRHGTFIDLVQHVPEEVRPGFAQGYGIALAEDMIPPGLTAWWPEWDLRTLRPHVTEADWGNFLFGLGCGHAVAPRVDVEREKLLASLTPADGPTYGLGFGWCVPNGPGATSPPMALRAAAENCAALGRASGPRLGRDVRGPQADACSATVRPAVPDLWTYLRPR